MGALRKTFLSNLLLLIGLNLLIKPFYLLIVEANVQERMGADAFGLYFALLNISYILNIIPDVGITNWNNRHVAQEGFIHQDTLKRMLSIRLVLAILYILACSALGWFMQYKGKELFALIMLAFNQVLATGILFMRSYLSGMHAFRSDRLISICDRLFLIIILGGALVYTDSNTSFPIDWLIYSQTVAFGATLIIAFVMVWRLSGGQKEMRSASPQSILISSLPFAVLILFSMISSRADGVILERIRGSFEAGIYAMTYRIGDMLTMISYLFAVMLLPLFARQIANQESPKNLFDTSFRLLLAGCVWVVCVCCIEPEWILSLIYSNHLNEATIVLPWAIVSAVLFSLQYTTGTLLTAGARMRPLITLAFSGLLINVTLNILLIPELGALGAAQAACSTQLFIFITQAFIVQKIYKVWSVQLIFRSLLFLGGTCGIAICVHSLEMTSLAKLAITTAAVAGLSAALKLLTLDDFQAFFTAKIHNT
jgi:O-antigen/teichoic acid export membrane protein